MNATSTATFYDSFIMHINCLEQYYAAVTVLYSMVLCITDKHG